MRGYKIHITGTGVSPMTRVFERAFEGGLARQGAGNSEVTYSWSPGGDMPPGYARLLDALEGSARIGPAAAHPPPKKGDPVAPKAPSTADQKPTVDQRPTVDQKGQLDLGGLPRPDTSQDQYSRTASQHDALARLLGR